MAEKRQIPINGHSGAARPSEAAAGHRPDATAGAHSADAAPAGTGSAGAAHGAAGQSGTHAGSQAGAHTGGGAAAKRAEELTAERDALLAERDAAAKERDALVAERDATADALLRLRAEFDNFRRRTSREVIEAEARAHGELLKDLLPVLDNLDRALDAAEHHEEGKVLDGVRMTRNMFAGLLVRAGVEGVGEVGEAFDPNLHEAVLVQASAQPEGSIAAVLQRGYRQGERVLRAARVAVSSGPGNAAGSGGTPESA